MVATLQDFSNAAGFVVDEQLPGFVHSWEVTLGTSSGEKKLNDRDMGYFTSSSSTDPSGSDRAVRAIEITNQPGSAASVHVGGAYGRFRTLAPGDSITICASRLGAVSVQNKDASNTATIEILILADDE